MRFPPALALPAGALLLAATLAGCAAPPEHTACPTIPAVPAETMPKPPVSETPLIWQPGHWEWTSTNYAWQQGAWVPHPAGNRWVSGAWSLAPGGSCIWNPAHFM